MKQIKAGIITGLALWAMVPAPGWAQAVPASLESAVQRVTRAWMAHDYRALLAGSDTVRLQLPDVGRSPSVRPSQAAKVLEDYLGSSTELALELRSIRMVNESHAYAEMARVFAVEGTRDERVDTVFLGFRRVDGQWRIREVRITR